MTKRNPTTSSQPPVSKARSAPPVLTPYRLRRDREFLTPKEIDRLVRGALVSGRHGARNATMILFAFHHALRVGELVTVKWQQIDLADRLFFVNRLKNGLPATHPLPRGEVRLLRRLRGRGAAKSPYVFVADDGHPLTTAALRKIVAQAGQRAGLPLPVHPHMLRHSCGFHLNDKGVSTRRVQLYMGHRSIQNTALYMAHSPRQFDELWKDDPATTMRIDALLRTDQWINR